MDVNKVIKSLGSTDWGKDNEAQMKAVQLLKGIATSDDEKSNAFMQALSTASAKIAKNVLEESVESEVPTLGQYSPDLAGNANVVEEQTRTGFKPDVMEGLL